MVRTTPNYSNLPIYNLKIMANSTEEFIEKSKEIHGDKFTYERSVFKHRLEKLIVTCVVHGDMERTPKDHYRSKGCLQCFYDSNKIDPSDFIKKSKEVHGDNMITAKPSMN